MLIRKKEHKEPPKTITPDTPRIKFPDVVGGFDENELYDLWLRFKDSKDAETILSDFMCSDKKHARILLNKFELRYESHILDSTNRGAEDRTRKHI